MTEGKEHLKRGVAEFGEKIVIKRKNEFLDFRTLGTTTKF